MYSWLPPGMCIAFHLPSPGCGGTVIREQNPHNCVSCCVSSGLSSPLDQDDLPDQLLCSFKLCCELYGKLQFSGTVNGINNTSGNFVKISVILLYWSFIFHGCNCTLSGTCLVLRSDFLGHGSQICGLGGCIVYTLLSNF